MSLKMTYFIKTVFILVIWVLFPAVEPANGTTDLDVKLFDAAQGGDVEKISVLLEQGADINVRLGEDG